MSPDHAPIKLHPTQHEALIERLRTRFPAVADLAAAPDRRQFLKVMAASLSLAGLAGCDDDDPRDQEVPPVNLSQGASPGTRLHYASAALLDGFANGIRVTTSNGRPIKIEGNPAHPWSRGGTDVFGQASVLSLYDPYRSQSVLQYGRENTWDAFRAETAGNLAQLRATGGAGLRVLTGPFTSPTQAAQLAAMLKTFPKMHWHSHAAIGRAALYHSTQRVVGRPLETRWKFENARVIVALDGDFLDPGPHQVGAAKSWSAARRAAAAQNRLLPTYSAAALPGLTAAKADHSVTASPAQLLALAQAFLAVASQKPAPDLPSHLAPWFNAAATALLQARGAGIVQAGGFAAPDVQDTVHRINAALGNTGKTVVYTAPIAPQGESLHALVDAMNAGQVQTLALIDTNPIYDAPGSLDFASALTKIPLKIHAGLYADETAAYCDWHLPIAHTLESWGDARALDGTTTLIQPCIAQLYNGRTTTEVLSLLSDPVPQTSFAILQNYWKSQSQDFENLWHQALLNGFITNTAEEEVGGGVTPPPNPPSLPAVANDGLTLAFRADPTIWDGTPANNAWLQELPKPLSKLVWQNAIWISRQHAAQKQIQQGDIVEIGDGTNHIKGPAWIAPGQADDVISITLGYGRQIPNQLATGLGIDAYTLRDPENPWQRQNITLTRTEETTTLATTIAHTQLDAGADAPFIRTQPLGAPPVGDSRLERPTLYPRPNDDGRAWGMVIDLDSCIGCNACITACQAENNIAVVGRDQVIAGREMHWLRIDAETTTDTSSQAAGFMPVPCMQCEQAPCEIGCPVEATLHDHEGLNLMVYNRCIGTRACSGYCPYKVRRFNYFDYSAGAAPSLRQQRNPDVTVRAEGVMEKCTFCVQRIAEARITADTSDGTIADGAVRTACQSACPTDAIVFGDMADAASQVSKAKTSGRNYALLGELNTRPRTTYLARLAPAAEG
jgi:molybdopterin-containing oxidoreductase family iron-sulfur binding subunit